MKNMYPQCDVSNFILNTVFNYVFINVFCQQHTIDEVENLIKKHEAFEKAAAAQEERFVALERLTTVIFRSVKKIHF